MLNTSARIAAVSVTLLAAGGALADAGTLADTGTLVIDSIPASYVLVDGRPLGPTPLSREGVSTGRHDVAFVYSPGVSCHQSIDVAPGATAKVIDRLGTPESPGRRCRGEAAPHP
jgi:hypothetical protein